MTVPSQQLQKSIADWLSRAKSHDPERMSSDGSGVRIYADIGGAAFIRPDGSLIFEAWDSGPYKEQAPGLRTLALVVGSREHPELRELLPSRPAAAPDCELCGGTGRLTRLGDLNCGSCFGLGWKPAA
jgi:hypothetical protein